MHHEHRSHKQDFILKHRHSSGAYSQRAAKRISLAALLAVGVLLLAVAGGQDRQSAERASHTAAAMRAEARSEARHLMAQAEAAQAEAERCYRQHDVACATGALEASRYFTDSVEQIRRTNRPLSSR